MQKAALQALNLALSGLRLAGHHFIISVCNNSFVIGSGGLLNGLLPEPKK